MHDNDKMQSIAATSDIVKTQQYSLRLRNRKNADRVGELTVLSSRVLEACEKQLMVYLPLPLLSAYGVCQALHQCVRAGANLLFGGDVAS